MKKRFKSILLILCMALFLLPRSSADAAGSVSTAESEHIQLADGGYHIYCLSGAYVTVDTYPSLRNVQLSFPDATRKTFYVENKGNNQITLRIENPYSSTGYSYVGIEDSIKNGTALKSVDGPYLWNIYSESKTDLVFSLRPPTNEKMVANASGQKNAPRTKIILWSYSGTDAPTHGEFRFEPAAASVKTPVTEDYSLANLTQTQGFVTPVKIEIRDSTKSPGAVTVLYDGSPVLPKAPGTYPITFDVAAAPPAWGEAKGLKGGKLVIVPKPSTAAPVGKVIKIGGINWRVLDVQDGKALVLSDLILDTKEFQKTSMSGVWADSSLRAYLNGDFYNKTFSKSEKGRIVSTTLVNNINPEYSNTFGTDTKDKVFLLSAEEATRYFGKDKARVAYADRRTPALQYSFINNTKVNPYSGVYQNYSTWHWWLRTPATTAAGDNKALLVTRFGEVQHQNVSVESGIRPAMWINVAGGGFKPYQPLKFNNQPNYFTREDMVLAIARDIIHVYSGDWVFEMGYGARGPGVTKTQATVGADGAMPPGYGHWFYVYRMRCWGVLSLDDFDPFAKVTYGQFKDYLMKTVEWNWEYHGAHPGSEVDKAYKSSKNNFLATAEKRAGISDTRANAKPVKAEIKRLSQEVIYWFQAVGNGNAVRLLEGPEKTEYKVGEKFDIKGLVVVSGPYGKEKNLNKDLTFTTSGVTLTPGSPFTTAGEKSITISYKGQNLMTYPVTVKN